MTRFGWLVVAVLCGAVGAVQPEGGVVGDGAARHTNRLAGETSPYLLQHAHNPVDWYPWGEEAFAAARERGVPIFLSIGYSTCYWCHVMERESFENEAIAALMNERFVCVKVDREERPDVDDIYMMATMLYTGRGGWPMSVFLEPEGLRPFFAGTYFPAEPRQGLPSFPQVIEGISSAWRDRREDVMASATSLAEAVAEQMATDRAPTPVGRTQVTQAATALLQSLDRANGGFGGAPKFPQPSYLELLMDVRMGAADEDTAAAVDDALRLTLDAMATGGIHDQVGGGFHRYAVDATWTVPHFEKMLYDNAQLASLYARASRAYGDAYYASVARDTLDYVLREMRGEHGVFFSAQDAEVDHREGLNYLWTAAQVRAALDEEDAALALRVYGLDRGTNFKDPHHPEDGATNVLRLEARPDEVASRVGMEAGAFRARLAAIDARLLSVRDGRKQPHTDDKVLAAWNGLMIGALAQAGAVLGEARYVEAASGAADFVLGSMVGEDGTLLRSYRAGTAGTPGFLEDHAFVIAGLVELHRARRALEASADDRYLEAARSLAAGAREAFGAEGGGYFDTRAGQSDLFVRTRTTSDGAIPSGSSAMLHALLALHEATGERAYLDEALGTVRSLSADIASNPLSTANATRALLRMLAMPALAGSEALGDTPAPAVEEGFTPVEIFARTDRVAIGEDRPGEFSVRLKIADGFHVLAADPGPGGRELVPLRVHVVGGTGFAAYADYPAGAAYEGAAGDDLLVHEGQVELTVVLEATGDWSGRPVVAVTYQACTDTECLMPATVELDVAVDRE